MMYINMTRDPEIAEVLPTWDYLRIRWVYKRVLREDEKGFIGTIKLLFFNKDPRQRYEVELFNSQKQEMIRFMSADSLSRILEDMLGMHQLDSREIDSQLRKLSCDIPTPWVWHPWRPENVDDFLENIDKRFSLE